MNFRTSPVYRKKQSLIQTKILAYLKTGIKHNFFLFFFYKKLFLDNNYGFDCQKMQVKTSKLQLQISTYITSTSEISCAILIGMNYILQSPEKRFWGMANLPLTAPTPYCNNPLTHKTPSFNNTLLQQGLIATTSTATVSYCKKP